MRGPASVAERKIVGDDGDESFARRVDDAGGDDTGGIATEAHGHGECLLAVRAGLLENAVEIEGDAREVAEVFEQGEERKENGHGRQHDADDPRAGKIHAVDEESGQPRPQAEGEGLGFEPRMHGVDEQRGEQARGDVRTLDGDPQGQGEEKGHGRNAGPASGQDAVEAALPSELRRIAGGAHVAGGQGGGFAADFAGDFVLELRAELPAHFLGLAQDVGGLGHAAAVRDCSNSPFCKAAAMRGSPSRRRSAIQSGFSRCG